MKIRNSVSTQGKRVKFKVDEDYYTPENGHKSLVFGGLFAKLKYCVAYTKVKRDCGKRFETRYGVPAWVDYDNGMIGYQCFNFFDNKEDARKDFEDRKKLTPKTFTNTFAYADVYLIENN